MVYRTEDIRLSGIDMRIQKIDVAVNAYFVSKSKYRCLFERLFRFLNVINAVSDKENVVYVAAVSGGFKFWFGVKY